MAASFSLTASLRVVPRWVDELNTVDVIDTTTVADAFALTNGTAAGEANGYFRDVITIAAGGTATVDLRNLTLRAFGGTGTLSFSSIKTIVVRNRSTTASLSVGVATANRWSGFAAGAATLAPSGCLYSTAPAGLATSASDKVLAITNNGATAADVELVLAGVKA